MKNFVVNESWIPKRMKTMRFSLINLHGRIVERSRQLMIRTAKGHPMLEVLLDARQKIMMLFLGDYDNVIKLYFLISETEVRIEP